jgi:hypothetical protein
VARGAAVSFFFFLVGVREGGVVACCLWLVVTSAAGKLVGFFSEVLHGAVVAVFYG